MSEEEIVQGLRSIARERLKWEGEGLDRAAPLRETLRLDSLRALELLVAVEDRFRVAFEEEEEAALRTVGDLVDLIRRKRETAA